MSAVNTKRVKNRRVVRYGTMDDLLSEARRLARVDVRPLGNWSQSQIYEHIARSLDSSIDGAGFALPAPIRWIMSRLMKRRFLTSGLPAGFRTPPEYVAEQSTTLQDSLASLERAIERQKNETVRAPHPAFGRISLSEWTEFNLRHAELHMSFLDEQAGNVSQESFDRQLVESC